MVYGGWLIGLFGKDAPMPAPDVNPQNSPQTPPRRSYDHLSAEEIADLMHERGFGLGLGMTRERIVELWPEFADIPFRTSE